MKIDHRTAATYCAAALTIFGGGNFSQAGCPCQKGISAGSGAVLSPIPMDAYSSSDGLQGMPYDQMGTSQLGAGQMGPSQFDPNQTGPGLQTGVPIGGQNPYAGHDLSRYASPNSAGPGFSAATKTTWQPPPGTIGETYQMKSRPIPVEMNPRAAIVDVRIPNATNVRVHDMNVYRTQDFLEGFQDDQEPSVWHFTAEPLIPGLQHIYRIEARVPSPDGEKVQERYVRLIMGRVIEISF